MIQLFITRSMTEFSNYFCFALTFKSKRSNRYCRVEKRGTTDFYIFDFKKSGYQMKH